MTIIEATQVQLQLEDIRRWVRHPEPKLKRTAGVHLSGILYIMAKEFNLLREIDREDFEEEFPLRMIIGMGVERQLAGFYPDMKWQPGEVSRDGVIGSPDGFTFADHEDEPTIEEFKYTHKSCRNFDLTINKHKLWLWQMMGYCAMYPKRPTHARLHVMFGVGDYNRPYQEQYWRFLLRFDQAELDRFWSLVLKFKDRVEEEKGK